MGKRSDSALPFFSSPRPRSRSIPMLRTATASLTRTLRLSSTPARQLRAFTPLPRRFNIMTSSASSLPSRQASTSAAPIKVSSPLISPI
jgi:hypothetical protein